MKKLSVLIAACFISSALFTSAFAADSVGDEFDKANATQGVTQQSKEEAKIMAEKEKDAKELYEAMMGYKAGKVTKSSIDALKDKYNLKYGVKNKNGNESATVTATATSKVLNIPCNMQQTNYYCGPASAFNVLKGLGVSSYNGRSLTQANLATDLGTTTSGTSFPGTWGRTMTNWSGRSYGATWASSQTDWKTSLWTYTYIDIENSRMGLVYDTHMWGSNQLVGYALNSERWHYVAGDGYDQSDSTNKKVHYVDSNNLNNTAFGPKWTTVSTMATCTTERGMIW